MPTTANRWATHVPRLFFPPRREIGRERLGRCAAWGVQHDIRPAVHAKAPSGSPESQTAAKATANDHPLELPGE